MTGRDWAAVGCAFAGAFLVAFASSGSSSVLKTLLLVLGLGLLAGALALAVLSVRDRLGAAAERTDWAAFERSLEDGVRFDVPDGMGYAAELPALLDDMADIGEPSDGLARHAIVGEHGDIHWCAFQHQRPGGTSTVGMVGLLPDRDADRYPRVRVTVKDPAGSTFAERFDVMGADSAFADRALAPDAQAELMQVEPFDWRLEGNQIVTTADRPSTPEEQVEFIESRVLPLARVAELIPLDA